VSDGDGQLARPKIVHVENGDELRFPVFQVTHLGKDLDVGDLAVTMSNVESIEESLERWQFEHRPISGTTVVCS
jgi:CRISPR type IV-associated protein Csf3